MEEAIFRSGNIEVTRSLARINGVSYPIANIGSMLVQRKSRAGVIVLGIIILILGIGASAAPRAGWGGPILLIVGALAVVGSFMDKTRKLIFKTSSGDQMALEGPEDVVHQVKSAIEKAVTIRG